MVGSHVRLGYVRYRKAATTAPWRRSPGNRPSWRRHDHALKGRLQIEILLKQGAAHWRKGDREAADRAFAEMMKPYRARQSRGADEPFTKYYVASLCALRGESADALRYLADCVAARPALTRVRARVDPTSTPCGKTRRFAPCRRRRRHRALADGGSAGPLSLLFTPSVQGALSAPFHKEPLLTFKTLSFTTALVLASAVAYAQAPPPAPAAAPAPQGPPPQPVLGPNEWNIDQAHSTAGFTVTHLMVSTVPGSFGKVSGKITYDGKNVSSVAADVTIDATTISTNNERRDTHLKSPDFFEVAKYPTLTFKSTKVVPGAAGKFKLVGDLTITA
jgi:polyisoprenoid-binding protein YceI